MWPFSTIKRLRARVHALESERRRLLDRSNAYGELERNIPSLFSDFDRVADAADGGYRLRLLKRGFTELKQLRRQGLSDDQRTELEKFRETGDPKHLIAAVERVAAGQNAQATEVKFRQVKDVNRGLRKAIRNIIVNLSYARTLATNSNKRAEIEHFTLTEALSFTDLSGLGEARRLGEEALGKPVEERGFLDDQGGEMPTIQTDDGPVKLDAKSVKLIDEPE